MAGHPAPSTYICHPVRLGRMLRSGWHGMCKGGRMGTGVMDGTAWVQLWRWGGEKGREGEGGDRAHGSRGAAAPPDPRVLFISAHSVPKGPEIKGHWAPAHSVPKGPEIKGDWAFGARGAPAPLDPRVLLFRPTLYPKGRNKRTLGPRGPGGSRPPGPRVLLFRPTLYPKGPK